MQTVNIEKEKYPINKATGDSNIDSLEGEEKDFTENMAGVQA